MPEIQLCATLEIFLPDIQKQKDIGVVSATPYAGPKVVAPERSSSEILQYSEGFHLFFNDDLDCIAVGEELQAWIWTSGTRRGSAAGSW